MAPKTDPPAAKLSAVMSYLHNPPQAYTLKDLEKALPGASSVSSMQVKDFVNHLVQTDRVSTEKIGSGNWYWSFPADRGVKLRARLQKEKKDRREVENVVGRVEKEIEQIGGLGNEALAKEVAKWKVKEREAREVFGQLSRGGKIAVEAKLKDVKEVELECNRIGGLFSWEVMRV